VKDSPESVPSVDFVDEKPIGDAVKALDAGDPSSSEADTSPVAGLEGDPAGEIPQGEKGQNVQSGEKRGPGRPPGTGKPFQKKERPRGDATLTAKELDQLRKTEVATLLLAEQRKTKALEEKLEDARLRATIGDVKNSETIDDAIHEACGFAAETLGNVAAAKWGPAARINDKQKEQLATAWSRVAKLYLGAHAHYSPVAAALLATVAVAGEKYVDVQLAGAAPSRPSLVSSAQG